jgi:hypothetical protein
MATTKNTRATKRNRLSPTRSTAKSAATTKKRATAKSTAKSAAKKAPRKSLGTHVNKKALDESYNQVKDFAGQQYTGMAIGRAHKWYYDQGEWRERKVTPDEWQLDYAVTKRRAGRAPKGSGVPVGTEYHWFILAHQHVKKLNANEYTTALNGTKYKIAHLRADKGKWSASDIAQRRRLIKFLYEYAERLEKEQAAAEKEKEKAKIAKKK